MESRLIFRHPQKALKLSITQIAKVGEAVSWLLQVHTPLKPGENGLRPKHECDPCENGEAITATLTRKVL
jgi:hypothetical protein